MFASQSGYSGKAVTVDSALELVPVYSAVSLLAGSVGSLPLFVYRRLNEGRERATTHRMWRLLHDSPNPNMASDEMWELVMGHLCLWGNAFVAKVRDSFGVVSELYPISPQRVRVGCDSEGRRFYLVANYVTGDDERFGPEDILHIRAFGTDSLVGLSPIQQARQILATTGAMEEFSGKFWANSAMPAGVLTHPQKLGVEALANLKASWKANIGGFANAGSTAILEEGMSFQPLGMPLEDAQFIESGRFSDLRVAQLFRIPPYMLGASSGDSMTYSNTEMEGIDFVRWSLRRWLVRIEGSLIRDESLFVQGQRFYPEFLVDGLLRSSTADRYAAYQVGLGAKFLTVEEVRDRENLPPLKPGQVPDPTPTGEEPT
jgi:HK97 family phage portal protein